MKKLLLIALLMSVLAGHASVTGVVPEVNSSYKIYNVGQDKYLSVSTSGEATLDDNGTVFTLQSTDDDCVYLIYNSNDKLTSVFNLGLDGNEYETWQYTATGTDNTYTLASRQLEAYSFSYLIWSNVTSSLESTPLKPSATTFQDGIWMFVDPTYVEPEPEPDPTLNLTDANPTLTPGTYKAGNITYTRNVSPTYASFCLPFDVDLDQYSNVFTEILTPLNLAFVNSDNEITILMTPKEVTGIIQANTPFIAKVETAQTTILTNCVETTYEGNEDNPELSSMLIYNYNGSGLARPNYNYEISFAGTIKRIYGSTAENGLLTMTTKGGFGYTNVGVNPFRAYISYLDKTKNTSETKEIRFASDLENNETYIQATKCNNTNNNHVVYNVNGQKASSSNWAKLSKGIYIVNGRKVIK